MNVNAAIENAIERMLYHIIKLLLEWGVTEATFSRIARRTFVKVAAQQQQDEIDATESDLDEKVTSLFGSGRVTASSINSKTGIPRKEIKHLLEERTIDVGNDEWYRNQCTRVLGAWWTTVETIDAKGKPLDLYVFERDRKSTKKISFEELVALSGSDVHLANLIRELVAAGCVELIGSEDKPRVRALKKRYERQSATVESVSEAGDKFFSMGSAVTAKLKGSDPAVTEQYVVSMNVDVEEVPKVLRSLREGVESQANTSQQLLSRNEAKKGKDGTRIGAGFYVFRGDEMADSIYFEKIEEESKKSNG